MGEHGHWQKQTLFNDATRVPLIIMLPDANNSNRRIDDPVELVDIFPTLMELLQMETPAFISGKSLQSYLQGSSEAVRESALTELQVNTSNGLAQGYSIKTKRYRFTQWEYKGTMQHELYDHKFDKSELNNVTNELAYAAIRNSLQNMLSHRIIDAKRYPSGLGRQIKNTKPWFEPKPIPFRKNN